MYNLISEQKNYCQVPDLQPMRMSVLLDSELVCLGTWVIKYHIKDMVTFTMLAQDTSQLHMEQE
jgi:hypothetical protein